MDAETEHIDPNGRWDALAAYLLRVDNTHAWYATHASLSSWVADLAKSLGRSEATVWRALTAGRYYNDLRQVAGKRRSVLPELGSPQFKAAPESLELAAKIARVAPAEVSEQLILKVVEGTISRRELRAYWETYRPVLQGQTARGRYVPTPRFDPRSSEMVNSRLEADCIAGLIQAGATWLGAAKAQLYKVIPISGVLAATMGLRCVPDVVVLYQRDAKHPLEVHGVEVTARPAHNAMIRHYQDHGLGVDALWVVVPMDTPLDEANQRLEIGLLEASPQGVRVLRAAGVAKQNRDEAMSLLRVLLAHEAGA